MRSEYQLAIKTKRSGDTADYRVVAHTEGQLASEDFEALFKLFSVGTMNSEPKNPGEGAPWITLGGHRVRDVLYSVAILEDWTDRMDGHNDRPISASCCVCAPYKVLADGRVDFSTVVNQIPSESALLKAAEGKSGGGVVLEASAERWRRIVAGIEGYKFELCAAVAALLVETPVAVVKGGGVPVEERVRYLDAVAALLPYGVRASLSVSTWMMSASSEHIRLGFSTGARPNQVRLEWAEEAVAKLAQGSPAHRYYNLLCDLRGRHDTLYLVRGLSELVEPLDFKDPAIFIEKLGRLDQSYSLGKAVKAGKATAKDVRKFFEGGGAEAAERGEVVEFIKLLLRQQSLTPEDVETVRAHWDASLVEPALKAVKQVIRGRTYDLATLEALCNLAAEREWLDECLAALVEQVASINASLPHALELLNARLKVLGYGAQSDRVRESLLSHRGVLYDFMVTAADADTANFKQALDWLGAKSPEAAADLSLFRLAAGVEGAAVSTNAVEAVVKHGHEYLRALVRWAAREGGGVGGDSPLGRLAPPVVEWLSTNFNSLAVSELGKWEELLPPLRRAGSFGEDYGARFDLLSLAIEPRDGAARRLSLFLDDYVRQPPPEAKSYLAKLECYLKSVGPRKERIAMRLVNHCSTMQVQTKGEATNLMWLLGAVGPYVYDALAREDYVSLVRSLLLVNFDLLADESFDLHVREKLISWGRNVINDVCRIWVRAAVKEPDALDASARACANVVFARTPFADRIAIDELIRGKLFKKAEDVVTFLYRFREFLIAAACSQEKAQEHEIRFINALLDTDSPALEEYRRQEVDGFLADFEMVARRAALYGKHLGTEAPRALQLLTALKEQLPKEGLLSSIKKFTKHGA